MLLQLISAMQKENDLWFMFIIRNDYGIKCLSNLLQVEECNVILKEISDKWHIVTTSEIELLFQLIYAKQRKSFVLDVYHNWSLWNEMF